ncbi:Ig-like domain-containing protein, partial [Pseudomonas sp. 5P_3.1_Bac2]|uniref:Ig-like domain-containing protein n=1 Tax=Pseudomonas sp. 5P_3.1_Bac2 TaxID=2971617 RepID=UPI0021C6366D
AEADSIITLTKPDGSTVITQTDGEGNWALQPNPLGNGEVGKVTATDPSGNVSAETITSAADLLSPDAPVVESNNEAGLAGTGEPGGNIVVKLPDGTTVSTTVDTDGQWAIKPNPLDEGEQGTVTITDPAGNTSEPVNTGKADVTAPEAPVIESNNDAGLAGSGEAGGTIVVELPDGTTVSTTVDTDGQWAIKPNPLDEGEQGTVTITDPAGNTSEPVNTGKADVTAPQAPVVESNNEAGLAGTGEPGGNIVVKLPDGTTVSTTVDTDGQWAIKPNPLEDGESGTVTITDPAGNTSEPVNTGKADVTAPQAPVAESNNDAGLAGTGEPGGNIVVKLPDGTTVSTTVDTDGQWAIKPNPLDDGESGTVTITDPAGNTSEPTNTGKADVTAPEVPVIESNNEAGLAGTGEPGGNIVVKLPDGSTVSTTVDTDGQWAIKPNPLDDGESGTVTITDPAGNTSEPVNTGKADVTAPEAPVVESNNDAGLAGSGEAGGTIVVELPDGTTVSTTVDTDGQWAIEPNPLGEGEQGWVTITDPAGNISEPANTGKADLTAPPAPDVASNNLAGLTGTAEAGSTITLTKPDGSTVITHADKTGHWAFKPNPLSHGDEGQVTASDANGNVSAETATGVA